MNDQTAAGLPSEARPRTPGDARGAQPPMDAAMDAAWDTDSNGATPTAPATPGAQARVRRRQTGQDVPLTASADDEMTPTRKRRRVARLADSGRMPALRLNRYVGRERVGRNAPAMVYDTEHTPGHLRVTRLTMGLALLALAWVASLLVVALTESLLNVFPHQPSLTIRFGLYLLGAIGIIWLAVVALALIIVGAFSLTLALTRRAW